jgi:hypothetical protein
MMLNPSAMARFLAVRAVRLGLVLVLSAMIALGVYITYPGNDAFRQTLTQMGLFDRAIDAQLDSVLDTMVASAEIGPSGEVFFDRPVGDARFLEPNSGFYWQVSGRDTSRFPLARWGTAGLVQAAVGHGPGRSTSIPTSSPASRSGWSSARSPCPVAMSNGSLSSPARASRISAVVK